MKLILINADTFRRDHLGTYGNRWIHTPNLDRLAAEAVVFERHYIGSFPTIPNRRDVLLGHGNKGHPFNRWRGLGPEEVTLPARLRERRVPSMMITDVANSVAEGINLHRDFTAWTWNRGQEGDPCWLDETVPLEFPVDPKLIRYEASRWHQVLINRAHRQTEEDWFAPATYAIAVKWLEQNYRRKDFFLYLDCFDPHEPWDPPKWYEQMYDPDFAGRRFDAPTYGIIAKLGYSKREMQNLRARYAGEVTMVDACVGRLLATLERLGIYDDTLLIFTSDHGTYLGYPGDNGMVCKPSVVGVDGRLWEAGRNPKPPLQYSPHWTGVCRIPLIIRLPGQRKIRRVTAITQPWDLTPTIMDAFGMAAPAEFLGASLLPLVRGGARAGRRAAVLGNEDHAQVMTPGWLYAVWRGQRPKVLYDLRRDPEQKRDVSRAHPEVVAKLHRHVVAHLRRQGLEGLVEGYR